MGIEKAKSAKEINAEIKAKRNPAAVVEPEMEIQDAPISDADTQSAGSAQPCEETETASGNNDGASDDPEEKKIVPGAESA